MNLSVYLSAFIQTLRNDLYVFLPLTIGIHFVISKFEKLYLAFLSLFFVKTMNLHYKLVNVAKEKLSEF